MMTPDQIFAAQKKALDDQLLAKKQQEQAILDRRLAEEKREASPEARAERAAEDKQDMALLMLPFECAGALCVADWAGAETTQPDPNDPNDPMITATGTQAAFLNPLQKTENTLDAMLTGFSPKAFTPS